jgi:hypothetical protein
MQIIRSIAVCFALLITAVFGIAADRKAPVFMFGGKQLYVGMSEREALEYLSDCCKLSPPMESSKEEQPDRDGMVPGHFIFSKEGSPQRLLGTIHFSGGKLFSLTRPLDDGFDTWNDDAVALARTINRALSPTSGDDETVVYVSVRHERAVNAESDVLSLSFPNGRGIQLHIGTLDKSSIQNGKRDFATLDETLSLPGQR